MFNLFRNVPTIKSAECSNLTIQALEHRSFQFCCPSCGCDFLQQETASIFHRNEGQKKGVRVTVAQGTILRLARYREKSFSQRVGTDICYKCEGCSKYSVLEVRHRKGRNELRYIPCKLVY